MKCRRCYSKARIGSDYCADCAAEVSQDPIPHVPHLRSRLDALEAENARLQALVDNLEDRLDHAEDERDQARAALAGHP